MVESGRVQASSNKSSREIVVTAASSSWAPSRTAITRAIIPRWRSRKGKIEISVTIILATFSTLYSLSAAAQAWQPPEWAKAVDRSGWDDGRMNADETAMQLLKPAPSGPDGMPRIWVRTERSSPSQRDGVNFLSSMSLLVIDCREQKYRALQLAGYPGRNITGEPHTEQGPSGWTFAPPDTFAERIVLSACDSSGSGVPTKPSR